MLPSIRKTGSYTAPKNIDIRPLIEQTEKLLSAYKEVAPKAEAFDRIADASGNMTMEQAAKSLKMGRNTLFAWLRTHAYLDQANLPYQDYLARGYFSVCASIIKKGNREDVYSQTFVTPKGLARLATKVGAT